VRWKNEENNEGKEMVNKTGSKKKDIEGKR